jgi:signal recognition particle receptor subunit beta
MKIINNKLYLKIVFFGTALAGKTTSLKWLFHHAIPDEFKTVDQVRSLETSFGQTLFFDFIPIQVSSDIIVRMYTTTGQDYYHRTRRLFFEDADGIFLVIDSQKKELEHNREFVSELRQYLETVKALKEAEIVVLYNKQDLNDVLPPHELERSLRLSGYPAFPVCASSGDKLLPAFILMMDHILKKLRERIPHALPR